MDPRAITRSRARARARARARVFGAGIGLPRTKIHRSLHPHGAETWEELRGSAECKQASKSDALSGGVQRPKPGREKVEGQNSYPAGYKTPLGCFPRLFLLLAKPARASTLHERPAPLRRTPTLHTSPSQTPTCASRTSPWRVQHTFLNDLIPTKVACQPSQKAYESCGGGKDSTDAANATSGSPNATEVYPSTAHSGGKDSFQRFKYLCVE